MFMPPYRLVNGAPSNADHHSNPVKCELMSLLRLTVRMAATSTPEGTWKLQGCDDTAAVDHDVVADVVGDAPTAGTRLSAAGPFVLVDAMTLTLKIDGVAKTATFNTADFVDITAATAAEVAAVLETDVSGATSIDASGAVRITSDTLGESSTVEITGGTGRAALGFALGITPGTNGETAKWCDLTIPVGAVHIDASSTGVTFSGPDIDIAGDGSADALFVVLVADPMARMRIVYTAGSGGSAGAVYNVLATGSAV